MSNGKHGSQGRTRRDLLVAGGVTFIAWGSSAIAQPVRPSESTVLSKMTVEQMIAGWKGKPQAVARAMLAKYGLPHEATPMRLIWHHTGLWKRTEVVNEEMPHNFPRPHSDRLVNNSDVAVAEKSKKLPGSGTHC
jgi:hypothetical protein